MEVLTALTVLVGGAGVYLVSKVLPNFSPGSRKVDRDLLKMKQEIEDWKLELVPLGKEEIELLSLNQDKHVLKKGFTPTAKGVFTTIYHEPVIAYSYKQYISARSNALLYAKTGSHEYLFRILKKGVQVGIDNHLIGTIKDDRILYGLKKGKEIARINRDHKDLASVFVGEKEAGALVKKMPQAGSSLSSRAFEWVRNDLSPQEAAVFMGMVAFELVHRITSQEKK